MSACLIRNRTDGAYLHLHQGIGSFSPDLTTAHRFLTDRKARNYLQNNFPYAFPKLDRRRVEIIPDPDTPNDPESPLQLPTQPDAATTPQQMEDLCAILSEIPRRLPEMQSYYSEVLSTQDQKVTDLLHKIELSTFNACDGYKLARQLQDVLHDRRTAKDSLDLLRTCRNHFEAIADHRRAMENRTYNPRVLDELFKEDVS